MENTVTLIQMLERNAINRPDKVALIYKGMRLDYKELNNHVNRVANSLVAMGVKKGDRIGLMLQREPQLIIAFLASARIGAIPAPINFNITKEQLSSLLLTVKPSIVFTAERFLTILRGTIVLGDGSIVVTDNRISSHLYWDDLLKSPASSFTTHMSADDLVYLNFTSGSTGEQKGAMATHANIYWNTASAVEAFKITEEDVHLCMFAPFAHPHELLARALFTGGTMVLLDEIFPKSLARSIKDNGITCMMGLAPMYEMLLDVADVTDLSSLRIPESGGMFTRPDLVERFEKTFGVPIYTVWGSTETSGIAIANRVGEKKKDSSIGMPCPYYEVKVVDETGLEVKAGEVGEFIFKGPAVVKGYYGIEEKANTCFMDGWYHSGDLGKTDEEGFFYFVDRKKSMMKVAGLKVYPSEIEQVLISHPNIKEVAVVGSPDGLKGEIPKSIIVSKDGQTLTRDDIFHFCKGSLPNYKIPKIVEFRNELPKMSNGKINRKALMEESMKEVMK